jgi:citrate lyase gamma subunit
MKLSSKGLTVGFGAAIELLIATALLAADPKIIVANVIDKDAAESILEGPVKAPAPRNIDGRDGYYSKCNYYSLGGGKTLIVRVYQAAAGYDPHKELDQVAENSGSMRSISGLGDKARMSRGAEGGLPSRVVMLYVVKANWLVTVGISGFEDDVAGEKAKAVAQKILAHL